MRGQPLREITFDSPSMMAFLLEVAFKNCTLLDKRCEGKIPYILSLLPLLGRAAALSTRRSEILPPTISGKHQPGFLSGKRIDLPYVSFADYHMLSTVKTTRTHFRTL
jgi:hypothetical protein